MKRTETNIERDATRAQEGKFVPFPKQRVRKRPKDQEANLDSLMVIGSTSGEPPEDLLDFLVEFGVALWLARKEEKRHSKSA